MKLKLCFLSLLLMVVVNTSAQQQESSKWDKWSWLMGHWQAEDNQEVGGNDAMFSLLADLDNHVLIRKNHTEYTTQEGNRRLHHDLMIVYPETTVDNAKAIYFDNEGHVIKYNISYGENTIVLLSVKEDSMPYFRLVYTQVDADKVNIKFEMSRDGDTFNTYKEGNCLRVKK